MKISTILPTLLLLFFSSTISAQNEKYGKVSKEELSEKFYAQDTSANAAILFKRRRSTYDYNQNDGWLLVTKIYQRTKIYNKEGFDEATKIIKLFERGGEKEKVSIKATTFNLEGGKIVKTKLKGGDIFDEKVNRFWNSKKFTMPNIKPGSVIEWEYTLNSPYYSNLGDMVFQYSIPVKHIDTKISIPEYFIFKYLPNNYYPIPINQTKHARKLRFSYRTKDNENGAKTSLNNADIDIMEAIYEADVRDIPAIKLEPYTNNINNYRSKVSFELTAVKWPDDPIKYYNTTWGDVTKTIYKNESFGGQLNKSSYYKDDLSPILSASSGMAERLAKIFQLVKQKVKWNGNYGKYTVDGVRKAFKDGVGNVAEINLTLINMLREAGLEANPVLISTRNNGTPIFPTTDGYNYVIAAVEIENGIVLMDATEINSVPNELPLRDLNWQGRLVRKDGSSTAIDLYPKNPSAEKVVLSVKFGEDGLEGNSRVVYSKTKALQYRNRYKNVIKEDIIGKFEKDYTGITIGDLRVSNEDDLVKPIVVATKFTSDQYFEEIGNKIFVSPLLHLSLKANPFTLDNRTYPVDFGTPWEENYMITIEIPEGYTLETSPEDMAIALPDNLGSYKFMTKITGNKVQVLSKVVIKSPVLGPNYYLPLKEFYNQMVNKQLEKIVLVKS